MHKGKKKCIIPPSLPLLFPLLWVNIYNSPPQFLQLISVSHCLLTTVCLWMKALFQMESFYLFNFLMLIFFTLLLKDVYVFLIDWWWVYNISLISVMHQHELTIGVHMSSPSWVSLPPPIHSHPSRLLQSSSVCSLSHTANSHWLSVYIWRCRCIHAALSIYLTLSLLSPTLVHKCVLYICVDGVHLIPSSDGLLSDRPPGYTGDGKSSREKRWVPEPFRKWNALDLVTGWLWTVRHRDQVKDTHRFLPPASQWCHACCCFSHSSSFLLPSPSSFWCYSCEYYAASFVSRGDCLSSSVRTRSGRTGTKEKSCAKAYVLYLAAVTKNLRRIVVSGSYLQT